MRCVVHSITLHHIPTAHPPTLNQTTQPGKQNLRLLRRAVQPVGDLFPVKWRDLRTGAILRTHDLKECLGIHSPGGREVCARFFE